MWRAGTGICAIQDVPWHAKLRLQKASGNAAALAKWSFDASSLGRDVDMEGLTCGADGCASSIYIGDEYNYVYKLTLGVAGAATAVAIEWDVRSIVGNVQADKGIEALACALPWLGSTQLCVMRA